MGTVTVVNGAQSTSNGSLPVNLADSTQPQTNRCHFEDNTEVIYSSFFWLSSFGYIILHVFVVFSVNCWNSRLTVLKSRTTADKNKVLKERSVWRQGTAVTLWIKISYMSWSNYVVLLFPVSCLTFYSHPLSVFPPTVLQACLLLVTSPVYISPCLPVSLSVLLFCFLESPVLFCPHVSPFPIFCFRLVFLF